MKIYTKTGDGGETRVYAETTSTLPKDDNVLECYGTLDELNAHIGRLVAELPEAANQASLQQVQRNLFQIGFAVSATTQLTLQAVTELEAEIDNLTATLPAQTSFILPGGTVAASQAHVCRTVARRAERRLVSLKAKYPVPEVCNAYLNRLSDYLFVLARSLNHQAGQQDIPV